MSITKSHLSVLTAIIVFLLSAFSASPVLGQATLENPAPRSFQSGIGVISGWACDATRIEIAIDGGPLVEAAYGTDRSDTQGVCGDADNGFGLLFNWSRLDDGTHTVRALADGVEFANVHFIVTTFGKEFLTDDLGAFRLPEIPAVGTDVVLRWQQSQQKFVIAGDGPAPSSGMSGTPPRVLENPAPGSSQSGVGVISGWVCVASRIEISFNNLPPVKAAYGTSRTDTQSVCGDTNNGFGLLFNWNRLGDGTHTVRALADGVEFANVQVIVTTFGKEFLTDDLGAFRLRLDSLADMDLVVKYEEAQQSFVPWGCTTQEDPTRHTQCDTTRLKGGERVHDIELRGLQVRMLRPRGIGIHWEEAIIKDPTHVQWRMYIYQPGGEEGLSDYGYLSSGELLPGEGAYMQLLDHENTTVCITMVSAESFLDAFVSRGHAGDTGLRVVTYTYREERIDREERIVDPTACIQTPTLGPSHGPVEWARVYNLVAYKDDFVQWDATYTCQPVLLVPRDHRLDINGGYEYETATNKCAGPSDFGISSNSFFFPNRAECSNAAAFLTEWGDIVFGSLWSTGIWWLEDLYPSCYPPTADQPESTPIRQQPWPRVGAVGAEFSTPQQGAPPGTISGGDGLTRGRLQPPVCRGGECGPQGGWY